ncbi:SDR family NAD(P)-dependent oxidoreductase [Pedobacter agri]|uniref:SDR family NAD(P)-dependent oxidoreductase n=1 Tax=Pedobacter agri TaxID=454586 RepID=UPI001205267C|nr:SDR family NAD(P)-dependent oxidoreductase [Pedobacter agri]RZK70570.1 MAG: SDR family NAD(P)-dependent oxidoreductase [Pedobacter sp.]
MQKVIIMGASSGIGRELSLQLAKQNYHIAITGRRTQKLEELKAQYPEQILYATIDNTEISSLEQNLDELTKQLGGLDLLILCSGIGDINNDLDFTVEERTIAVNVTGFTKIADWTILYFQKQKYGQFAAITSIAGMTGYNEAPAYNASKAYQINYLLGLRKKMKKLQLPIYITDIRPGFVNTDMAKGEGQFWVAPVDKAVSQAITGIKAKKQLIYITRRWRIIGFILRIFG